MMMSTRKGKDILSATVPPLRTANPSLLGAAYEVVCFRHHEKRALRAIDGLMGHSAEEVRGLAKGEFLSRTLDGGLTRGKLF